MSDPARRARATAGILVGLLLAALDGTVVATALPRILDELSGFDLYFLPATVFMLCQTVSMPLWGRFSDLYGRGPLHLLAVGILVAASVLCGLSRTMGALVAWRSVQGLGAGGLMALSFTMIADLYEQEERARMQGAISSVWGVAALFGPLVGGWVTRVWSWQGVFYLNVPVGIVSAALVQASWERRARGTVGRPDLAGAFLLALASAALLAGFGIAGREARLSGSAMGAFGAAAVLAAALVAVERRRPDPFLAYDLYRNRLFAAGAATGVCAMTALFAAVMHVPLLVAGVLGKSLETGGYMLTCMMGPWIVCSALTRVLLARFSYRTLAVTGMALAAASYALLAGGAPSIGLGRVIAAMLVLGTGLGLTVAPLLIAVQNAAPRERLGAATSLTQFTRSMGAALGLAVMGGLLTSAFGGREPEGIIKFRAHMDPEMLRAAVAPLAEGLAKVFRCALAISCFGAVLACAIPGEKARDLRAGARLSAPSSG
ncbi:MAG TPA: MFS transporter [Planctomycetota bacterium]|nr:MFS transporter [Planctomycetota bacterium]